MKVSNAISNMAHLLKPWRLQIGMVVALVVVLTALYRGSIWWIESTYDIDIQYKSLNVDLLPSPAVYLQQLKVIDKKREAQATPLLSAAQLDIATTYSSLTGSRPVITNLHAEQLHLDIGPEDHLRFQSAEPVASNWDFPGVENVALNTVEILYRENTESVASRASIKELVLSPDQNLQIVGHIEDTPFIFNAEMLVKPKQLYMPRWSLSTAQYPAQGSLEYDTRGPLPQLDMDIQLEDVTWESTAEPAEASSNPLLFSNELLPLGVLRDLNANVDTSLKSLTSGVLFIENLQLPVQLEDGLLKIGTASADLAGGDLLAAIEIDYRQGIRASWRAALDVRKARLSELPGLASQGVESAGRSSMLWEMQGYGRSSRELLATSSGKLQVKLGEFILENKVTDAIGGDIVLSLLDRLRTDTDDTELTEFHCGAINFKFREGKLDARKKIVFQTNRVDVLGNVKVNFHNERIALNFNPSARGGVGINLNEYTSALQIGGYLGQPKLGLNAVETAKIGLGMWASANTGGVSKLAQSVYKKIANRNKTCHKLLPSVDSSEFLLKH